MTLFTIETSTQVCSAAWCIDHQCVASRQHTSGSNHAALLPVFIDELLAEGRQHGWQADAVAVSIGPGSYTGLRIGLSTAKGLCYGWRVPLIPIPTLDILCQSFTSQLSTFNSQLLSTFNFPLLSTFHFPLSTYLIPMLDARRMEVYTSVCTLSPSCPLAFSPSHPVAQIVDNTSWLPQEGDIYYFGDGAAKCQSVLTGDRFHFIPDILPLASAMGAACMQHQYPSVGEKDLAYFTPCYLKEFIAAPSHIKGLQ